MSSTCASRDKLGRGLLRERFARGQVQGRKGRTHPECGALAVRVLQGLSPADRLTVFKPLQNLCCQTRDDVGEKEYVSQARGVCAQVALSW